MDDGSPSLLYLYDFETHCCGQDQLGIIKQDFKNNIKNQQENGRGPKGKIRQGNGFRIVFSLLLTFHQVYDLVRRDLLDRIENPDLKERIVGGGLPSKDALQPPATASRCVPKAPDTHDDIILENIQYKKETADKYLLRRSSRPGEDRDVLLWEPQGL